MKTNEFDRTRPNGHFINKLINTSIYASVAITISIIVSLKGTMFLSRSLEGLFPAYQLCRAKILSVSCVQVVFFFFFLSAGSATAAEIQTHSKAEEWVLRRVVAGQVADLSTRFPRETDRTISSSFLEQVLTLPAQYTKVHRRGVDIRHAVFLEKINLQDAKVTHPTKLIDCRFNSSIDLTQSVFESDLYFTGSSFQAAAFSSMKVGHIASFQKAVFAGPVDFRAINIGFQLNANEAQFKSSEDIANFSQMRVGQSASFWKAIFAGPVEFLAANIGFQLIVDEAQFTSPERRVIFSSITVGDTASFQKAVFAGPVDFRGSQIGSQFLADEAQFTNTEHAVILNNIEVRGAAFFKKTVFAGPVDFRAANIASQFMADEVHFMSLAIFGGMKVGQIAFFRKAIFSGSADFSLANISSNFEANEAQFTKEAIFKGIKIGNIAAFNKALFLGSANFYAATIGSSFGAPEVQFKDTADFTSMTVGQDATFDETVFEGSVSFRYGKFLDLLIAGPTVDKRSLVSSIDLSQTLINRQLMILDVQVQHLIADSLRVEGPTSFKHVTIKEQADFEHSNLQTLRFSDMTWPETNGSVKLDDMSYRDIRLEPAKDSWRELIGLVDRSSYTASAYASLEAFFKLKGYTEYANEVFIAQKWRERRELLDWYTVEYWWNWFLYLLVAYGKKPFRALLWSILFISVGYHVFRKPEDMEVQKQEYSAETYSPFWYSLGLFLPFVNLYSADVWRPKKECSWARIYMRVHILAGWVLVPIGLAAITGIIK